MAPAAAMAMKIVPVDKQLWGACPFCMAIAAAGAIVGWSFTASYWLFQTDTRIVYGLLTVSLFFSAILAVHIIGYRRRAARNVRPPPSTGSDPA